MEKSDKYFQNGGQYGGWKISLLFISWKPLIILNINKKQKNQQKQDLQSYEISIKSMKKQQSYVGLKCRKIMKFHYDYQTHTVNGWISWQFLTEIRV